MAVQVANRITETNLFKLRIFLFIFVFSYNSFNIFNNGWHYFYFFTSWNWVWLAFYFFIGCLQSFVTVSNPDRSTYIIDKTQQQLFAIVQPISWFVMIVYWLLLSGQVFDPTRNPWYKVNDVTLHVMNLVFPLLDLFFCSTTLVWSDVIYPLVVGFAYQAMVVAWHLLGPKKWPYPFLVPLNGGEQYGIVWGPMLGFAAGVLAFLALFFVITRWLVGIRDKYFAKKEEIVQV